MLHTVSAAALASGMKVPCPTLHCYSPHKSPCSGVQQVQHDFLHCVVLSAGDVVLPPVNRNSVRDLLSLP
jgi:hypothetical protein